MEAKGRNFHKEVIELLLLLQALGPSELRGLCVLVSNNNTSLEVWKYFTEWKEFIISIFSSISAENFEKLQTVATNQATENEREEAQKIVETLSTQLSLPEKELDSVITCLLCLHQLQHVMKTLTETHLLKLAQVIPSVGDPMNQFQLFQQLQELFGLLKPDVLENLKKKLEETDPSQQQQKLIQLLNLPAQYFQLYQPLSQFLQMPLDELLLLHQVIPKLEPYQSVTLLHVLQLQTFDIVSLRNMLVPLLNSAEYDFFKKTTSSTKEAEPDHDAVLSHEKKLTLQILEQPPEKSVYKRNLKPNPSVQVNGEQGNSDVNLFVVPVLIRCDNFSEETKFLTGNKPIRLTSSKVVTFKKLKITTTSHQQQETLFCLRFELRRYLTNDENGDYEVVNSIHTNPICVLSHSTQLKPNMANPPLTVVGSKMEEPSNKSIVISKESSKDVTVVGTIPLVIEVIPSVGATTGGTRVAIIGANFVDSPAARVKFDDTEVLATYHGNGTIVCHTPEHVPGTVPVYVSNANKSFSETFASFTYLDSLFSQYENGFQDPQTISPFYEFPHSNHGTGLDPSSSSQPHTDSSPFGGTFYNNSPNNVHFQFQNSVEAVEQLCDSSWKGDTKEVGSILEWIQLNCHDSVSTINQLNKKGFSALHYATANGFLGVTDLLLENGGSLSVVDSRFGNSSLHWALIFEQSKVIPHILTKPNADQLHLILNSEGYSPLALAIALLSPRSVIEALIHYGGKMSIGTSLLALEGATCLHIAAGVGSPMWVVQLLLRNGASPKAADFFGDTPFTYAHREQHHSLAALLYLRKSGSWKLPSSLKQKSQKKYSCYKTNTPVVARCHWYQRPI